MHCRLGAGAGRGGAARAALGAKQERPGDQPRGDRGVKCTPRME